MDLRLHYFLSIYTQMHSSFLSSKDEVVAYQFFSKTASTTFAKNMAASVEVY